MFAMHEYTRKSTQSTLRDFVASIGRNILMISDSDKHLTAGFTQIQRVAALALKFLYDFFHTGKEGLVKELFVHI